MAVQKQDGLFTDVGESASDLKGQEFKFCKRNTDGTIALCGADEAIAGVISEGKAAGYHTSFNTKGNPILKVICGSAIAIGDSVACGASGLAKTGATNAFGVARSATTASGQYVEVETR
jgi:hypothetical protein